MLLWKAAAGTAGVSAAAKRGRWCGAVLDWFGSSSWVVSGSVPRKSGMQRYSSLAGSAAAVAAARAAVAALLDPTRAEAVAELGEATGRRALRHMYYQMLSDPTGSQLLRDQPRLNSSTTLAPDTLRALPTGSLGRTYLAYCEMNGFSADERPVVTCVSPLSYARL
jgi:ubiquinone biosynthesis protein Coq4